MLGVMLGRPGTNREAPALPSKMDAASSAASNAQDAASAAPAVAVVTVERQGASRQPTTSAADNSFIGPSPEPSCAGGPDASAAASGGGSNDGLMNDSSGNDRQGADQGGDGTSCNDDDDDLTDLADVDVHIPLHDMDDSETDDEDNGDNNADPSMADNEVTARAPSIANGWDDNAVTSCFERAIRMHSMTAVQLAHETNGDGWEAGPNVLPLTTMTRSTENGAASSDSAENNETTNTEQPICSVAKIEVVTTSICDPFGENDDAEAVKGEEDQKKRWKPRPLPLPAWAVDPIYAAANLTSTSRGLGDIK